MNDSFAARRSDLAAQPRKIAGTQRIELHDAIHGLAQRDLDPITDTPSPAQRDGGNPRANGRRVPGQWRIPTVRQHAAGNVIELRLHRKP